MVDDAFDLHVRTLTPITERMFASLLQAVSGANRGVGQAGVKVNREGGAVDETEVAAAIEACAAYQLERGLVTYRSPLESWKDMAELASPLIDPTASSGLICTSLLSPTR